MPKPLEIHIPVKSYGGRDPAKRAKYEAQLQAATVLHRYLAEQYVDGQPKSLTYQEISRETGVDFETVKELLFAARGGNNGITI